MMQPEHHASIHRQILTVAALTDQIKTLLERNYPFVWVSGEVSNVRQPASGHVYFTLKDKDAQISAVIFKGQMRNLAFNLEDGLQTTGLGRVSVYKPRGAYQIIFEYLEPKGIGALQVAYEQLKQRLAQEGLFDTAHKKDLPDLPKKIGVITSPTGAVVHDILNVVKRRFPSMAVNILPVSVQGETAVNEITAAVETANKHTGADVIILARGGGSLEDLLPFNSEAVARAVFNSQIPIISAIGHETDFTIIDFVADLRAPTPSAAAEIAVPLEAELKARQKRLNRRLLTAIQNVLAPQKKQLAQLSIRLIHPKRRLGDLRLQLDEAFQRMLRLYSRGIGQKRREFAQEYDRFLQNTPLKRVRSHEQQILEKKKVLLYHMKQYLVGHKGVLSHKEGRLRALNPVAILKRGYSIARLPDKGAVIQDTASVSEGQEIEVLLSKGILDCRIKGKR